MNPSNDDPESGLSQAHAAERLLRDGPNSLLGGQRRTLAMIFLETLREPMFLLLIAAGSLYLAFGDLQEGLILFGLVLVTVGLTLYQEGKTEHAMAALRELTSPRARVVRDGQALRVAGADVVAGDILLLAEGDRIAADATLLSSSDLQVDESLLTGEAIPVGKRAVTGDAPATTPGGDDLPFVYSGTLVVQGQGMARVTATGARSEIGRIGEALGTLQSESSPLKKQMAALVRVLAILALVMSLLLVIADGLIRGDWSQALLAGIALAMAMLPQEFTVVLTVLPALGAWRLSHEKLLVRRISAIETLGATTVLCVDKTGTLTENRMTVTQLHAGDESLCIDYGVTDDLPEAFHTLVEFAILASETDPYDPMEQAFHRFGQHFLANTEHLHRDWELVHEYGLTPELRAMAHVWKAVTGSPHVVAAKGAPEAIIDLCHLDAGRQQSVLATVNQMAAQGLRVLAVAQARFPDAPWPAIEHDFDFEFVGLLGLTDPLRTEVPEAVRVCREAGIRVLMITGDYPATARVIAREAGLAAVEPLSGDTLAGLDDAALQDALKNANVCARIAPAQKLRIVRALMANGEVVAMTGDGVNDAPALKAAHVGIAMGGRGTDVAREAASLVLLDDNFASIVRAVRQGRRIFDNLRKSMSYILAVHVPIAGMALLPVLLGWPVLLYPLHIAFLEIIIGPACSMVFENEPAEPDVMRRPPRNAAARLFGGAILLMAFVQGLGVLAVALAAYAWGVSWLSGPQAHAFAFATLVMGNLSLIFSNRARRSSLLASLRAPNRVLWIVAAVTLGFLALSLYQPWLAGLFRFAPLPLPALAAALGLGMSGVFWYEAVKWWRRPAR